jgi:hypothetical protein
MHKIMQVTYVIYVNPTMWENCELSFSLARNRASTKSPDLVALTSVGVPPNSVVDTNPYGIGIDRIVSTDVPSVACGSGVRSAVTTFLERYR